MSKKKVFLILLLIFILIIYYVFFFDRTPNITPDDIKEKLTSMAGSTPQTITYWYISPYAATSNHIEITNDYSEILMYISNNMKRMPYSRKKVSFDYYFRLDVQSAVTKIMYTIYFDRDSDILYINNEPEEGLYYSFDVLDVDDTLKEFLKGLILEEPKHL